jgi:hypothetical protein
VKVKVQALGTSGNRWTCHVMMNCLYFSLDHTLDYILMIKQSQGSDIPNSSGESGGSSGSYIVTLACNIQNSKSYCLKSVEVTQMSHLLSLSPSRNEVGSKPWSYKICDRSDQRCLSRGYNRTTVVIYKKKENYVV